MKRDVKERKAASGKNSLPDVIIDASLEKYKDEILFPEKLEKVNAMLKTAKLPEIKR